MNSEIQKKSDNYTIEILKESLSNVREGMKDNPYIIEAIKVLSVDGYRSAIGLFWNAVIDDLRNKIMFRSLTLFNKEMKLSVKTYEDFQNFVNDDQLIDGAYKIGVIDWEAHKLLKHSKEIRHFFSGHPKSSNPTKIKVCSFIEDCVKYVLNKECPVQIIDIDDYIKNMDSEDFDRNNIAIENGIGNLPEIYKNELIHRLFSIYTKKQSSSIQISNVELVAPILWKSIEKDKKIEVIRRIDGIYVKGDSVITEKAFQFIILVNGVSFLSPAARKYKIEPIVKRLNQNLDDWNIENQCVMALKPYASVIPEELIDSYVSAITQTYVGTIGTSYQFSRTDFYANQAAIVIPDLFKLFNDRFATSFVKCIKENDVLKSRISNHKKLKRLRSLGIIVKSKVSEAFPNVDILDLLIDETKEQDFKKAIY